MLLLGMLLVVVTVSAGAADSSNPKPSAPMPAATNAVDQQVIAYYFHGTIRCETCLKIEEQAKEAIERRFKAEVDAKRLVFKSVNYDQPENAHFLQDYKLPSPSLVLVRQKDGKDEKWRLLNETWQLVEEPVKFNDYVETEMRNFLSSQEQQTSTNKGASPPAPDHR